MLELPVIWSFGKMFLQIRTTQAEMSCQHWVEVSNFYLVKFSPDPFGLSFFKNLLTYFLAVAAIRININLCCLTIAIQQPRTTYMRFKISGNLTGPPCLLLPGLCLWLRRSSALTPLLVPRDPSHLQPRGWVSSSEPWVQTCSQSPLCLKCAPLSSAIIQEQYVLREQSNLEININPHEHNLFTPPLTPKRPSQCLYDMSYW